MQIIYAKTENILDLELKNHLQKFGDFEIVFWNSSLDELYNEMNQIKLDLLPKIYVLKNVDFFATKKEFQTCEKTLNLLLKCDENIVMTTSDIKEISEIDNFLKKINLIKIEETSTKNTIIDFFKKNEIIISDEIIDCLVNKLPNNKIWIMNELEKLKHHKQISIELINSLIGDYQSFEIFQMSEAILNNKMEQTLTHFKKAITNNVSIEEIVAILISYFLKIYFLKIAIIENDNINNIIENYSINKFWFKNIYQILKNIRINKLKYILNILFNFDIESKSVNFDKYLNFKLILLNFFKD